MTRTATFGRPSWLRLVLIQFGLIARSGRWIELIGGAAALYVFALFGPAMGPNLHEMPNDQRVWGQWALYCLLLVAVWPSLLWRGEQIGRRHYHWSLPVPRGSHDLARIAAGGLWVVALIVMLSAGSYVSVFPLAVTTDPQPISDMVAYGVGLLTLYCVASVFTVVVAHPTRWFFGILTVYVLLWAPITFASPPRWVYRAWGVPIVGRYGLFWATMGAGSSGDPYRKETANTITTSPGDRVALTVTITDSAAKSSAAEPQVEHIYFLGPHWKWGASAVWIAGSIGAMLLVSARRRER